MPDQPVDPVVQEAATPPSKPRSRGTWIYAVLFVAILIVINALVGEKGLLATFEAQREYDQLQDRLHRLRQENALLQLEAQRLRDDPATIEALARDELGLVKPGEVLFIVKDVEPDASTEPGATR